MAGCCRIEDCPTVSRANCNGDQRFVAPISFRITGVQRLLSNLRQRNGRITNSRFGHYPDLQSVAARILRINLLISATCNLLPITNLAQEFTTSVF